MLLLLLHVYVNDCLSESMRGTPGQILEEDGNQII